MTYDRLVSDVVQAVEATGAAIMIVGASWALVDYAVSMVLRTGRSDAYRELRQRMGQAILLGLEILIIGDIVRTIIVDPTIDSVTVLGLVVLIRIVLSFSLEVEIDGAWPWNVRRLELTRGTDDPPGSIDTKE